MDGTTRTPIVVIACGEPLRGDDRIAHVVVDGLSRQDVRGATVRHVPALWPEDLAGIDDGSRTIIVDAVVGIEPGDIVRVDLMGIPTAMNARPTSSHQLPLDMVVALAKLLGWQAQGVFIGIGTSDFTHGAPLSTQLRGRIPDLSRAVAREIERARYECETDLANIGEERIAGAPT